MNSIPLYERCKGTDIFGERFVGLKMHSDGATVYFPLGYNCEKGENKIIRKEILSLLSILQKFSTNKQAENYSIKDDELDFPIRSYQFLILDYLNNGYYTEKETIYDTSSKGKINWKQTIQKKKPYISDNNAIYLDFIVKKNRINDNTSLTRIHEFCVYLSFMKLGWLYTPILPMKPRIKFNQKAFLSVLQNALAQTYNDSKKQLFTAMINIINNTSEGNPFDRSFSFGTTNFEYVWESLIDYVFGENNKDIYFPKARWKIVGNKDSVESSSLRPDTIISLDNKIYILDAKYYKYGLTANANDLPSSDSIQKQITYGEYLESKKSEKQTGRNKPYDAIYNAFIMPFDKCKHYNEVYKLIGVATADWKNDDKTYENVLGILLDTKYIINSCYSQNFKEIQTLTLLIEDCYKKL